MREGSASLEIPDVRSMMALDIVLASSLGRLLPRRGSVPEDEDGGAAADEDGGTAATKHAGPGMDLRLGK